MTKRIITAAILLLAALTGLRAQLNWQKTNGPTGSSVEEFVQDSTGKIWVLGVANLSTSGSFISSTNDGQTWQVETIPYFSDKFVWKMEVGPNGYLYALGVYGDFHRSTDDGATWTGHNFGTTIFGFHRLAFMPNGDLLLLDNQDLLKSTDFGETWAVEYSFGNVEMATLFATADGTLIASGSDAIGNSFVQRSADGGQSFLQVNFDINGGSQAIEFDAMAEVGGALVGQGALHIVRSVDDGLNWEATYSKTLVGPLLSSLQKSPDGKLYFIDEEGYAVRSDDGGISWGFTSDLPRVEDASLARLFATRDGAIVINAISLFRSADDAATWQDVSQGIVFREIESVAVNPATGTVFAQAFGVFRSTDSGQNWQWTYPGHSYYSEYSRLAFSAVGDAYFWKSGKLIRSLNDGITWDTIQPAPTVSGNDYGFAVAPSGKLFFQTEAHGFRVSTDKGITWDSLPSAWPTPFEITAVDDSLLFASTAAAGPGIRSLDGGNSWNPAALPYQGGQVNVFFWTKWGELFMHYDNGLYRSTDLGATWAKVALPKPSIDYIGKFITTAGGQMYLFFPNFPSQDFLLYSDDFGVSWVVLMPDNIIGNQLNYNYLNDIALLEGQKLFAATAQESVWQTADVAPFYAKLSGQIKKDEDNDCAISAPDLPIENWSVTATAPAGPTSYASTDQNGEYHLGYILPDSATVDLQIEAHAPNYLWAVCDPILTATVSQQIDTANHLDFSATAEIDCAMLNVSVNFWPARPCSTLTIVANYCNLGSILAADATLRIIVDPLITVNSTSLPIFSQSGDTLVFSLGNVGIGACGSVSIVGTLSCDAVLGQSICVNAHASPDSLCGSFPDWSGAYLFASAKCAGDSLVEFSVKNIGNAPSTSNLDYIVIEDQILLKTGSLPSMIPGQEMLLSEMPDGKTLRIEAEQEPGHPLSTFTAAWVEGCGTNPPSWGWILPYLGEDGDPFSATYCREVTTSYDPNAKEALPAGFGTEHFIRPGQSLDYFIQFQNTGNDTAFLVVLRDTLDAGLDPATVRMGASSHPMEWEIYGPGILKFVFKNILLPDSTTNEPASHGWVSFNIEQRPGLPLGTVIRNNVGIYFDANPPVLTNQTWHTLGENFLPLAVEPSPESAAVLTVSPNPMGESAIFELKNLEIEGVFSLKIMDSAGRTVRTETVNGPAFEVFRKGLPVGLWFFSLEKPDGGPVVAHGKLLAR